jgi:hypothetical protein
MTVRSRWRADTPALNLMELGVNGRTTGAAPDGAAWIAPLTFLISLFSPGVRIYETHNRGRWYDFGFIIGVSGAFGGSGSRVS